MLIGGLLTAAMVAGLAHELLGRGLAGLSHAVPRDPRFYLFSVLLYLSLPTGDYIIFRRLWGLPLAGLGALVKKRIANEVVLGYAGEAYFYAWSREHARNVTAPFGAVKDVSILSALAGNAITLAMVAIVLPLGHALLTPAMLTKVEWSSAFTVVICLPFLLFAKRVFSLPRHDLWWIFAVHCTRLCAGSLLIALAWHFALPSVSVAMWLFLAAGRLLVSRLPLVPNKDLIFANLAIVLIGHGQRLSDLVAMSAAVTLLINVAAIAFFTIAALRSGRAVWR